MSTDRSGRSALLDFLVDNESHEGLVVIDTADPDVLVASLAGMRYGEIVIVVPRVLASWSTDLIRFRRPRIRFTNRRRAHMLRTISGLGWTVVEMYDLWPSHSNPRIIVPHRDRDRARWIQSRGALSGSSNLLIKAILRSRLLAPLVIRTAQGTALLVRLG